MSRYFWYFSQANWRNNRHVAWFISIRWMCFLLILRPQTAKTNMAANVQIHKRLKAGICTQSPSWILPLEQLGGLGRHSKRMHNFFASRDQSLKNNHDRWFFLVSIFSFSITFYWTLVYTRSWTITNPEFWLASQPWTIRNSPWLAKWKQQDSGKFLFCKCLNGISQK